MDYYTMAKASPFKTKNNKEVLDLFIGAGYGESYINDYDNLVICGYDNTTDIDMFEIIYLPDGVLDIYDADYPDDYQEEEYENCKRINFVDYLQEMLEPDEEIIINHIGYEGLRYLDAWADYISKNKYRVISMATCLREEIERIREED